MQRLEVSCAVRRVYTSLGAEGLIIPALQVENKITVRNDGTCIHV